MDEFAQTRGDDDLFDDEIIPASAEEQQQAQTEVVVIPEPEPIPAPAQEVPQPEKLPSPRGETPQRGRGGDRGRARGPGNRGKGLQSSRWASPSPAADATQEEVPVKPVEAEASPKAKPEKPEKPVKPSKAQRSQKADKADRSEKPEKTEKSPDETQAGQEEDNKSENGNGTEAQRVPAVRGDRSATGGIKKPKLTEEELSKRIAAAKENAAKKAAAHARAEADQASFIEREQVAAKKRREELAHRKVMDTEREQNRQRKLKAQTGREWDLEKREEDYNPRGGGSQFRRGMHGGVSGYARHDFEEPKSDDSGSHTNSGRGRGRGGRGGRGRGGRNERSRSKGPAKSAPVVDNEAEFPSLPAGKTPEKLDTATEPPPAPKPVPSMEHLEATMSPVTGTWADQVEE